MCMHWGGLIISLPVALPKRFESATCLPRVRVWNQTRFVCVGSTLNKWYCALTSKLSSSLKSARAARYSSFGSGPTTGAQNSKPSARQAPSSFVPMPAVSTSLARATRSSGLIGKSDARNRASSSTHCAAKSASAPDASLTGAAAAASSAGVGVGLTAAGAATAASSDGRLSRYDGAATVASMVGDDVCGNDSRYDALSFATLALSMVAVLAWTARFAMLLR
mmetsp:Transcript_5974/g.16894  ORF Transcript_5974/g.16894 Transcript_5974/m.16894 type:complete len:222 (+) Transcript_5974:272-937(+)